MPAAGRRERTPRPAAAAATRGHLRPPTATKGVNHPRRGVLAGADLDACKRRPFFNRLEREAVRSLAANRSLHDLAAEFGVSHETIRAVLRDAEPARAA